MRAMVESAQRRTWPAALLIAVGFVAVLWFLEVVDQTSPRQLDAEGIRPRSSDGLSGILLAPLLHGGYDHLAANSVPTLVFLFLVLLGDLARGLVATLIIWMTAGVGTWIIAPPMTVHVGASGLIFGWLTYLLLRGFFARRLWQIALGVVLFVIYGGLLWGVLPGQPGISWQGHLFGAIGGVIAARVLGVRDRRPSAAQARW